MVAHPEEYQHLGETGVGFKLSHPVHKLVGIVYRVHVIERKIAQYPRAVRRLPPERPVRKHVGLVPPDLLRDERVDPRIPVEGRHVLVIAEGVRVPSDLYLRAELVPEVLLGVHQLARPGFARGEVAVRLHPHPADDLPSSVLHALLYLSEEVGIEPFDPVIIGRGALRVGEVGTRGHHVHDGGKSVPAHHDRFLRAPQPCGVDVRVCVKIHCEAVDKVRYRGQFRPRSRQ